MIRRPVAVALCAVVLGVSIATSQERPRIAAPPTWIKHYSADTTGSAADATGDLFLLLLEAQEDIARQELFAHVATKILNTEGVQSGSDISVSYDPSYQTLAFCSIDVCRNGKRMSRLSREAIQVYQRATSMEMHTYDKTVDATIHIPDVRTGDVVEYSYVVSGYIPTYEGRYFDSYYLSYSTTAARRIVRILTPANRPLTIKARNDAPKPAIQTTGGGTEYLWDVKNSQPVIPDDDTPSWYDPYQSISMSEFSTWGEVARWAAPMYAVSKDELLKVARNRPPVKERDPHRAILETIRFVQDEVRYVFVLSGLSAHKPTPPATVLARRFGDCKDKSLLLVSMLQAQGVKAKPVLVNVGLRSHVADQLPSPTAFNHCIVTFSLNGRNYFVDPTIRNQGGTLDGFYFPAYGAGLVIDASTTELSTLPASTRNAMSVTEHFVSPDAHEPASFHVRTIYNGQSADQIRTYFKTTPVDNIEKAYADFYKRLFPEIYSTKKPQIIEDVRWGDNRVVVEEDYSIPDFWQAADSGSTLLTCELRPLILDEYVRVPDAGIRKAPYAAGNPIAIRVATDVELPEEWSAKLEPEELKSKAFSYKFHGSHRGNHINLTYEYERHDDQVGAEEFTDFVTTHQKISKQLSYVLTWNTAIKQFSLSWISIVILVVVLGAGGYAARRIFVEYNPPPRTLATSEKNIGGWLVFIAIGAVLSPLRLGYDIFTTQSFFNSNVLTAYEGLAEPLVIEGELVLNVVLLLMSLLVAILFFEKRTSFPKVFTIYSLSLLAVQIIDLLIAAAISHDETSTEPSSVTDLVRMLVYAAVWIPYVWNSTRCQETFVRRHGDQPQGTVPVPRPETMIVCSNCGERLRLDASEMETGKYICPTCGKEGTTGVEKIVQSNGADAQQVVDGQ